MADRFAAARRRMVERQLAARGIADERVLAAMGRVPRDAFVPADLAEFAYDDNPLPIAEGQTISQPYIVALMAEAARIGPDDARARGRRRLRLRRRGLRRARGGGGRRSSATPRSPTARARRSTRLGYSNVKVLDGDGSRGVPERAPYDAILVAAGAPAPPDSLKRQLAEGGRLVIPVSVNSHQELRVITRRGDAFEEEDLGAVRFVPLMGEEGWLEHELEARAIRAPRARRERAGAARHPGRGPAAGDRGSRLAARQRRRRRCGGARSTTSAMRASC